MYEHHSAMPVQRKPNCGKCGTLKVERGGRLHCPKCACAASSKFSKANPHLQRTPAARATKARFRNKVRATGLTNQKAYSLKKRYGLTEDAFIALVGKQGGLCAICNEPLTKEMLVDHDHATGAVRGLLCRPCNFAIGLFADDPARLRAAAGYLERNANP